MSTKKPGGGSPKKVKGVCAVCRSDVGDPVKHQASRSHQENVARWDRRPVDIHGSTLELGL